MRLEGTDLIPVKSSVLATGSNQEDYYPLDTYAQKNKIGRIGSLGIKKKEDG